MTTRMKGNMQPASAWKALQEKLVAGAVLRHTAGLRHPVAAGYYCPLHEHESIEIVFHPTGRGVTRTGNAAAGKTGGDDLRALAFDAGDVIVYAPRTLHDQRMEAGGEDHCVQLRAPAGHRLTGALHIGRVEDAVLRSEMELLAHGMHAPTPGRAALLNLRATAVLLQLLELAHGRHAREAAGTRQGERHVRAAERYVQEHYARIGSVLEIAAGAGLGGDHLRHLFRRLRGRTLVSYLNEVRVARARTLLAHSPLTLKEIAALCGWRDEYYFSAVFRRSCGMAPGRYREERHAARR
ncbi:DNA-binding domain-containing protein, AraC-type [Opitutaceae bacterium TAV1]|nr:AraC family transcriptional regulator [Opitutaceae bacterium TAV5]EIP99063.1 DNA-binding domain-containing protein, AraC-type [Opitutaceae bacterium TAV1]